LEASPCRSSLYQYFTFNHRAEVGLAIISLQDIKQDADLSFDADSAQSSLVASVSLPDHVSNRIQHSQFALLEALFLRRALRNLHLSKAGPETLSLQFFPRRKYGSSRTLRSKKLV
jgi:hypothetical protein